MPNIAQRINFSIDPSWWPTLRIQIRSSSTPTKEKKLSLHDMTDFDISILGEVPRMFSRWKVMSHARFMTDPIVPLFRAHRRGVATTQSIYSNPNGRREQVTTTKSINIIVLVENLFLPSAIGKTGTRSNALLVPTRSYDGSDLFKSKRTRSRFRDI